MPRRPDITKQDPKKSAQNKPVAMKYDCERYSGSSFDYTKHFRKYYWAGKTSSKTDKHPDDCMQNYQADIEHSNEEHLTQTLGEGLTWCG